MEVQSLRGCAEGSDSKLEITSGIELGPFKPEGFGGSHCGPSLGDQMNHWVLPSWAGEGASLREVASSRKG